MSEIIDAIERVLCGALGASVPLELLTRFEHRFKKVFKVLHGHADIYVSVLEIDLVFAGITPEADPGFASGKSLGKRFDGHR